MVMSTDSQQVICEREERSKNRKESLVKVAVSFLESTTAHGLPRVATERTVARRTTWLVIFIVALCYFLYQFSIQWEYYKSYPVGVKTGVIRRNVFTFPAVTLCNSNVLKRSKLNGTNFSTLVKADEEVKLAVSQLPSSNTTTSRRRRDVRMTSDGANGAAHQSATRRRRDAQDTDDHEDIQYENTSELSEDSVCLLENQKLCELSTDQYDQAVSISVTSDMSDIRGLVKPTWQELEELGYTAEEFIGQCSFDNKPCWVSDFSVIRDSEYGNCFVFNSVIHGHKVLRRTNKAGLRYGLRLTLSVSQEEYVGLLAHEAGVRVTVHSPWVHPFPNDKGVSAGVGLKTQIGTRLTKQTRLPAPYPTECSNGENIKLAYPGNYTVLACISTCKRNHIHRACNCFPKAIKPNDARLCKTDKEEKCMTGIIRALDNGTLRCDCHPACDEENYLLTMSSVPWPSDAYTPYVVLKGVKENWLDPYRIKWSLTENLVRVHVFIDDTDILTIDEYPAYTWQSLMADTGGYLGLFIGVSVCTVLEVFEFFFDLTVVLVKWRRRNKQLQSRKTKISTDEYSKSPETEGKSTKHSDLWTSTFTSQTSSPHDVIPEVSE